MVQSGSTLATPPREERRSTPPKNRRITLVLAFSLTGLYWALILLQIQRNLWFDELLTFYIAREQSLSRLLDLVQRWDLNPPVLHVLAHFCLKLAGGNPIATRIPSAVEFYLASVLLFVYAARKMGSAFAALPVIFCWYSAIFSFATEARPYAGLCFWFCALLVLWDSAVNGVARHRALLIAGVACTSVGLLATHVLAPLSIVPFLIAEWVRFRRRRVADLTLWLALTLPLTLTFAYLPFFSNFRSITEYPPAFQASWQKIASFYWHTCLGVLACLAVAALAAWLFRKRGGRFRHRRLASFEIALWTMLLTVPIVLDLAMMAERAPFWGRYCITSALGIYFVGAYSFALFCGNRSLAGYAAISAAGLLLLVQRVAFPLYSVAGDPVPQKFAPVETIHPDLPLVAASGLTFGEMGYYESPATRARLFYLLDRRAAVEFAHATMFEDLAEFQQAFQLPGTVESLDRFTSDHKRFLVIGTFDYPEDWLLRKLAAEGAQIKALGSYSTPYKDKSLFEVRVK